MKSAPTASSIQRSSVIDVASYRGEANGLINVDAHQARDARLAHGDTDKLRGKLHRRLVVRDDDELNARGHLADDIAEAPDVVLIERRVHLVEQAEGCRVQIKD